MPKSRIHPNSHKPVQQIHKHKKPASAVLKITLILCLLGLAIGSLGSGFDVKWMIAGSLVGALGGFFMGMAVDRTVARKKST